MKFYVLRHGNGTYMAINRSDGYPYSVSCPLDAEKFNDIGKAISLKHYNPYLTVHKCTIKEIEFEEVAKYIGDPTR